MHQLLHEFSAAFLHDAAAAVAEAIARVGVAELSCLPRVPEPVNALKDRVGVAGKLCGFGRGHACRVASFAKNSEQPLRAVVPVFPFDGQATGLMQHLGEEMGQAQRRRNSVRLEQ